MALRARTLPPTRRWGALRSRMERGGSARVGTRPREKVGDRVAATFLESGYCSGRAPERIPVTFFQDWSAGKPRATARHVARGVVEHRAFEHRARRARRRPAPSAPSAPRARSRRLLHKRRGVTYQFTRG